MVLEVITVTEILMFDITILKLLVIVNGVINMYISNLVRTTRFWKNLHQVHSISKC